MADEALQYLFARWLSDEATDEQAAEFRDRFEALSPEEREQLLAEQWERLNTDREPFFDEGQTSAMLQAIQRGAGISGAARLIQRPWWRMAGAAAVITIFLATGGYFIYKQQVKKQVASEQPEKLLHDVQPGGNKAILTLSNGSAIVLDSAHTGQIAVQANANIIKSDSGKLVYNILKDKPAVLLYNMLTTPRGGQYQLALPDGTKVWLNAASSIKYPVAFIGKERVVEITGEAYFEVKHNAAMPFKVKAGKQLIEDIGTAFNVNAYADEEAMKVTLLEGKVKVNTKYEVRNTKYEEGVILNPGEQAVVSPHAPLTIDHSSDLDQVIAWKNGLFNFNHADLRTVLRQLERWYDIDVRYEGEIKPRSFRGKITRDLSLNQVIQLLEDIEVKFRIEGRTLIVTP